MSRGVGVFVVGRVWGWDHDDTKEGEIEVWGCMEVMERWALEWP